MSTKMKKFDVWIIDTNSEQFKYIKPVTSMDAFQGAGRDFHEDGLFSTSIFGKVGSQDRNVRMSYINLKIDIFAPKIFFLICNYKQFYKNIIMGLAYAKWDNQLKDFVKSTNIDGSTGFNFFLQHWKEIRFVKNASNTQNEAVDTIQKYKSVALTHRAMVIPAGLRDIEIDDNDEVTKHEINDFYVKLLSVANSLPDSGDLNSKLTDRARLTLQLTLCEIYDYLSKLTGQLKKSFMRKKWGNRRIKYGSRNVIMSIPNLPAVVGDPRIIGYNETGIGLFQAIAVYSPLMIFHITNGYMKNYASVTDGTLNLVNAKTLLREEVRVKPTIIDKWTTPTGIGKLIDGFKDKHLRGKPIIINGAYLGLVYKTDKHFKLINDINDLAGMEDKLDNVKPLTYGEFFYIHGYKWFRNYPAMVTRYPINGYRSTYPSYPHVHTTTEDLALEELNDEFQPSGVIAYHYPLTDDQDWFDGMSINLAFLEGQGADFDGDMDNFNPIFSDEGIKAVGLYLKSKAAYLNSAGELLNNPFVETLERVLYSLSGDPT